MHLGWNPLHVAIRGFEPEVERTLLTLLRDGAHFYDIGTNIGWYALLAARTTRTSVIAFEPTVYNAALAMRNARLNSLPITVVAAAVGDTDRWGLFSLRQKRLVGPDTDLRTVPVPVVKLDSWIAATGSPVPEVMKVDTEGGELARCAACRRFSSVRGPRSSSKCTGPTTTSLLPICSMRMNMSTRQSTGQDRPGTRRRGHTFSPGPPVAQRSSRRAAYRVQCLPFGSVKAGRNRAWQLRRATVALV